MTVGLLSVLLASAPSMMGAERSFVTAFFSRAPFWMDDSSAPRSLASLLLSCGGARLGGGG